LAKRLPLTPLATGVSCQKDLRDPKAAAKYSYEGKSESVRDVQFNPLNTNEFAAGFETGTIQVKARRNTHGITQQVYGD
jgi:hypothetical protein